MVLSARRLLVGGAAVAAVVCANSHCDADTSLVVHKYGGACLARKIPLSTRWCSVAPCRDVLSRVASRGCRNNMYMRVLAQCESLPVVHKADDLDGDGQSDYTSVRREAQNAGVYDKNVLSKEALEKKPRRRRRKARKQPLSPAPTTTMTKGMSRTRTATLRTRMVPTRTTNLTTCMAAKLAPT
ncbi:hypothetical protein H310_08625 [Aphanomyces invadans]|uniref:Uncharacterized protein n=1 Tax=Aphanomyces invadans TaxID=157072 RepID=A0A024TYT0_9STRA|nr:hypothetical protein H310_08625 [Aphanomyces invadans]ETV98487.1 hypothetical protein H310_08625 [Aphanomyces invadans]|eukprot:XP_008872684.1 hypothetical protein H310_08625 [Aphanomyces invadans]